MNEDIKKNEIPEEQLEEVSGGVANDCNRGYSCLYCGSDNIRVFVENTSTPGFWCGTCRRSGPISLDS